MRRFLGLLFACFAWLAPEARAAIVPAASAVPAAGHELEPLRRVRVTVQPSHVSVSERVPGVLPASAAAVGEAASWLPITLGELTLREARVFLADPRLPLAARLLALRSPGLQLEGDIVADVQLAGTGARLAPLADGSFTYMPFGEQDLSFDQVNAYYLACDFVNRWFLRHGWDRSLAFIGVRIQTVPSSKVIGQYQGGYASLYPLLIGGVVKHTAKDADLVRHEVAHAVLIPSFPMNPQGDPYQYLAFHEGMADYYAAIAGPDALLSDWLVPGGMRDLTTTDPGNYHMGKFWLLKENPYEAGRILSGPLLAIRRDLGTTLDEMVVAAASYPAPASLAGFADALRRVDIELHGGAHLARMDAAFARHGLMPGSPAKVSYDGPWYVSAGVSGTYAADVFGGYGPFSFDWQASTDGGNTWRSVGTSSVVRLAFAETSLLRCDATDQLGGVTSSYALPITVFQGEVPPPVTSVDIVGPSSVPYGTKVRYTLQANSAVHSPAYWGIAAINGSGREVRADVLEVTVTAPFTLSAVVIGLSGGQAGDYMAVTVQRSPAFVNSAPTEAAGPPAPELVAAAASRGLVRSLYSRAEGALSVEFGPAAGAGPWRAQLFDVRGGLVASADGPRAEGVQPLWSLAAVPPGVYFVRVATSAWTRGIRTVVVP